MHMLLGGEIEKHVIFTCTSDAHRLGAVSLQFHFDLRKLSEAGFCAAFTAIKFLSSTGMGGIQLSATITSCMWACRLTSSCET